jgi:hypothetical protein
MFNDNQLNDVALHEIQHVLGFGTLWDYHSPSLIVNPRTAQSAFIGTAATGACVQAGGSQADCVAPGVTLENTGGSGTRDGHWRKTVFKAELMTGFISSPGTAMPLSAMTIASLADLGYTVNTNVAEAYTVTSSVASLLATVRGAQGPAAEEGREELLAPRFEVARDGRVTKLR